MKKRSKRRQKRGATALELLFILGTFVIAMFAFLQIAQHVVQTFVTDGNMLLDIPLF